MEVLPHQANLRTGRHSESRAYSITKCAADGVSLIDSLFIPAFLIDSFFWMDSHDRFILGAFVVMPDHYHLVFKLDQGIDLSRVMKALGSFTARSINKRKGTSGELWQRGYYDRGIRRSEDIKKIVEYIHNNPVRKALVLNPKEWPYSSLNEKYRSKIRWNLFA